MEIYNFSVLQCSSVTISSFSSSFLSLHGRLPPSMSISQGVIKKVYSQQPSQKMEDHTMSRSVLLCFLPLVFSLCACILIIFYLSQLFASAANILWKIGGDPQIIQEFMQLASKSKTAASEAMDAEAMLGDIPDEFLDPIQVLFALLRKYLYSLLCNQRFSYVEN